MPKEPLSMLFGDRPVSWHFNGLELGAFAHRPMDNGLTLETGVCPTASKRTLRNNGLPSTKKQLSLSSSDGEYKSQGVSENPLSCWDNTLKMSLEGN